MSDPQPPVVLSYLSPDVQPPRPILGAEARVFHAFTTVLLPIICFGISAGRYPPGPEWQQGRWEDRFALIPQATVGWPFYPLLIAAMISAGLLIARPTRFIESFLVRIGLLSGVLLAWQYGFIQTVALVKQDKAQGAVTGIGLPIGATAAVLLAMFLLNEAVFHRRWYRRRPWTLSAITVGVLAVVTFLLPSPAVLPGVVIFGTLVFAPALTMASFLVLLGACFFKGQPVNRPGWQWIAAILGWLAAWSAAWVKSYANAIEAYQQLRTSPRPCYIATAAARGHRPFVGRRTIDGKTFNGQLAVLKAGELAIATRWPSLHRSLRSVYDALGPIFARGLDDPLIADAAFVLLKPIEWATHLGLAAFSRRHG